MLLSSIPHAEVMSILLNDHSLQSSKICELNGFNNNYMYVLF